MLINKCAICNLDPIWNGKPITFDLDHINGNHSDNRFNNLRILCPNCHRQTPTYAGKNTAYLTETDINERILISESKKKYCITCNIEIWGDKYCSNCYHTIGAKNMQWVDRPTIEQLLIDLEIDTYKNVGKKYGVSDNTIRKWIKSVDIELPNKLSRSKQKKVTPNNETQTINKIKPDISLLDTINIKPKLKLKQIKM